MRVIIRKTDAEVAITSTACHQRLAPLLKTTLRLDAESLSGFPPPSESLTVVNEEVQPSNLVYAVFTSGSTGEPKGVLIEHRSFHHCFNGWAGPARFSQDMRSLQFASYSFDASILEILGTLVAGGTVCVVSDSERLDSAALVHAANELRVSWSILTPSFIKLLPVDSMPTLKTLVSGGEAMQALLVERWADKVEMIGMYGPSETTIACTCTEPMTTSSDHRSIGKPFIGRCWVVDPDDHQRLLADGEIGELVVEGPHVGRGYLNEAEKTAAAFISRPTWHQDLNPNEAGPHSFYKTGDLCRRTQDGSLVFMGRKDFQVKVNGQRTELGEIEHKFQQFLDTSEHFVVELAKPAQDKSILVAFVASPDLGADESEAQRRVEARMMEVEKRAKEELPSFMIPSAYFALREIPITLNGKVDRKQLQSVGAARLAEARPTQAEREANSTEAALRGLWSSVLNLPEETIGLGKTFQSLGGDSISAMQIVSQARTIGFKLSVQRILQAKTIEALASGLAQDEGAMLQTGTSSAPEQYEEELDTPFKLSPIQQLFFDISPEGENQYNISYLLRVTKRVKAEALVAAFKAVVARHGMLRARFFKDRKGRWFQTITDDVDGSFAMDFHNIFDLTELMPLISKSQRSLDIQDGPLVRAEFIQMRGEQLLFVCGHHLVTDFVSFRVMLLQTEQILRSGKNSLQMSSSFQKWVKQQEMYVKTLSKTETSLPYDLPAPDLSFWGLDGGSNVWGDMVVETLAISRDISALMMGDMGNSGQEASAADILLAGVIHGFRTVFPERAMPAFYVEGHGREPWNDTIDLSSTVSWFTTITPILVSAINQQDPISTLIDTQDARDRIAANGFPYFASKFCGPRRDQNHDMEITFNYAGMYQQLERAGAYFQEMADFDLLNLDGMSPSLRRFGVVDIFGNVRHGEMVLSFAYNRLMKHQERLSEWMRASENAINTMVKQLCTSEATPRVKAPEFPLLKMPPSKVQDFICSVLQRIGADDASAIEDVYPCTPLQHGIMLSRISGRSLYDSSFLFELKSKQEGAPIDLGKLKVAWQAVIDRHASLRTIVVESSRRDGTFDQVVLSKSSAAVETIGGDAEHLGQLPSTKWVAGRPEHHLRICQVSATAVVCRLDINHVLIDGFSSTPLLQDLERAYDGLLDAVPQPRYRDYIAHVIGLPRDDALDYWKKRLAEVEGCSFPQLTDGYDGPDEVCEIAVPQVDSQKLRTFCRDYGLTLADLLKTAWALVLRQYTGTERPCFGYLGSGRDVEIDGIEDMVGLFTNIAVCAARVPGETTGVQLLKKVQEEGLEDLPHMACPLSEIQHALGTGADGLFDTVMSVQRRAERAGQSSQVSARELGQSDTAEFTIAVACTLTDSDILLSLGCRSSKIAPAHAQNIAATFAKVLDAVVHAPNVSVGRLDTLSEKDASAIQSWNSAAREPWDACIHSVISENAQQHPDSVAIQAWDGQLTYSQLDAAASRLAAHLKQFLVGPEKMVPVIMEKSMWTIVAMLAVLNAGGAFIPLAPDAPLDRLQYQLADANATVALTSPKHEHVLRDSIQQVVVTASLIESLPIPSQPLEPGVSPSNLAYVLYTSGSTGRPKGILVEHRQALSSSAGYTAAIGMGTHSRALQFAAYTFDASIMEIWSTLTVGGCICQISDEQRMDDVAGAINEFQANVTFMTPTAIALMQPSDIPCMKDVILGGEALRRENLITWAPETRLTNGYGPTETVVFAVMNPGMAPTTEPSSTGRSICCKTWIVDTIDDSRLAPVGAVGELWLEGPAVARGYLGLKEKTAEAFVHRPSWIPVKGQEATQSRFYRTGDLARYEADGGIRILGRSDTQAKIRGQRLELSEVEYHASEALDQTMAVAADIITPSGGKHQPLLALFVESPDDAGSSAQIKLEAQLPTRLPGYMVPSAIFLVQQLPRMAASGKLNRKELRAIGAVIALKRLEDAEASGPMKQQPQNHMEMMLQQLWSEVLNVPLSQIGANDSFFRLGGDSINAMRLVAAARKKELSLTVASVLRNPELSKMAMCMESKTNDPSQTAAPFEMLGDQADDAIAEVAETCKVSNDLIEDMYPTTPLQDGFLIQSSQHPQAYVVAHIITLPQDVDVPRFQRAWEKTVAQNAVLRTRMVQVVRSQPSRAMQVVFREEVQWRSSSSLDRYVDENKNMAVGDSTPLTRAAIIDDSASGEKYFVWHAHHSVYDGWSLPLIFKEVHSNYEGISSGSMPCKFSQFIKHQQKIINGSAAADYWKKYLDKAPEPAFPVERKPTGTDQTVTHQIHVDKYPSGGITFAAVLRAAWALVVSSQSDSSDVIFGGIVAGRNEPLPGIESMAAPTITSVPVRVRFDRDQKVRELLQQVQDDATATLPHESLGLQNIQALGEDAQRACAFRNIFLIQPSADKASTSMPYEHDMAVLDLGHSHTYPLVVGCSLASSGPVEVSMTHDPAVLDSQQTQWLVMQFAHLVQQLCRDECQDGAISDLSFLSPEDQAQISAWNTPLQIDRHVNCVIHELARETVRKQPDAVAICAWDGSLTYRELDDLSDVLASFLLAKGVRVEQTVALCFEKSKWYPVCTLAVLKAGGAFVPLDIKQPRARLEMIVQEVRPKLLLASPTQAARLDGLVSATTIVTSSSVNDLRSFLNDQHQDQLAGVKVQPHNLAFVFFTSGSTGKPKGILLDHGPFCYSSQQFAKWVRMEKEDRVLQFSNHIFDISLTEILSTLLVGGCICIPSEEARVDDLAGFIRSVEASALYLTPSVASTLDPQSLPSVKKLALGGEHATRKLVEEWAPISQLTVGYGPAECSVWMAGNVGASPQDSSSNIGRSNSSLVWIVDVSDYNRLAPVGVVGEMLIEGPILARGYTTSTLTQGAFIFPEFANPKNSVPRRMYKTGDLAKYNSDGTLHIAGRKDAQVKIRGQRVELEEVEHHMRQIAPSNAYNLAAEVIRPEGDDGSHLLAGFVEAGQDDVAQLIDQIDKEMPDRVPVYMVPSRIFSMRELPRLINGKLNRRELRQIGARLYREQGGAAARSTSTRAPETESERVLAELWAEVMGFEDSIGADDHFVRLGGDSVKAMRLSGAARRQGFTLSVASIMSKPRLSHMALEMVATDSRETAEVAAFSLVKHVGKATDFKARVATEIGISTDLIEDAYPCTSLQQGLFTASLKQPGAYICRWIIDLDPRIDIDRLQAAWQSVLAAHPILRTRIVQPEGLGLTQVVASSKAKINWHRSQDLDSYITRDRKTPMQLGDPLARFGIAGKSAFIFTAHHAVYDAVSLRLLASAAGRAYRGDTVPKAPPYNRFIKWLSSLDTSASEAFWTSYLKGASPQSFPPAAPPSHVLNANSIVERQIALKRQQGSIFTTATLVQTAWAILLGRYAESQDVIFGVTQSGRTAPLAQIDEMTGPTVTTVPVRIQLTEGPDAVFDILQRVQDTSTQMIPHQYAGLQTIRRVSADAKTGSEFRTLIQLQAAGDEDSSSAEMEQGTFNFMSGRQDEGDVGNFHVYPLAVTCTFSDTSIHVQAVHDPVVLDPFQMQRMLDQLDHILGQLTNANSTTQLQDIDIVSDDDRTLLREWNNSSASVVEKCLHTLFEEQVAKGPERPALHTTSGTLSYAEVEKYANRVAHHVRGQFHGSKSLFVPLCSEKSIWAVIGMFGILKAGHAFVLMDPSQPADRLRKISETVGASVALASPSAASKVSSFIDTVLTIDASTVMAWEDSDERSSTDSHTPAYAIFTSGSTGEPKGCVVEHCSFASSAHGHTAAFQINASTRALQFASYSYGAALIETLTVLLAGGCVCVVSEDERATKLVECINSLEVNWAVLTRSSLDLLGGPERVPNLQTLVTAGEPLSADAVAKWASKLSLLQGYGQAEASVVSTLTKPMVPGSSPKNIGSCVSGHAWVVESGNHEKLCPIGVVGELLVEGPHVGSGYIGRPEATAAVFIQKPAWLDALEPAGVSPRAQRLYKTGDLVKINGQRVELGEIENQLRTLLEGRGVDGVVVDLVHPEDGSGKKQGSLAAFLAFGDCSSDLDAQRRLDKAIRGVSEKLSHALPRFMVPSIFLPLQRLPLTASAKVDRKALRSLGATLASRRQANSSAAKKETLNDMERRLMALWKTVLEAKDDITVDDSFVELGGDSLDAMMLVSSARREGIELTVADVFTHSRLSDMALAAKSVESDTWDQPVPFSLVDADSSSLIADAAKSCGINTDAIEDVYPCTPLQEGLMALSNMEKGAYLAQHVVSVSPEADLGRMKAAWEQVVANTPALRTRIIQPAADGEMLQVVVKDPLVWCTGDSLDDYITARRETSMSLGDRLSEHAIIADGDRTLMVWVCHHAIFDRWAWKVIMKRLEEVYNGLDPRPLPPYNSFIKHLQDMDMGAAKEFWRNYLDEAEKTVFPQAPSSVRTPQPTAIAEHRIAVSRSTDSSLSVTISSVLQAAWALLVSQYAETEDPVIGVTLSGRMVPVAGIQEMAGPTIVTIPVRFQAGRQQKASTLFAHAQEMALKTASTQHIGLQNIQQLSSSARAACSFDSLLLIQPQVKGDDLVDSPFLHGAEPELFSSFNSYGLLLNCELLADGIHVRSLFDPRIIEPAQVQRMLYQLDHVLQQLCNKEDLLVADIEFTSPQDKQGIQHWGSSVGFEDACIHTLIEQQAATRPAAPAVCSWDGELSFGELDALASGLAAHLQKKFGTGHNEVVPIYFEKSMWTQVAILAALKAGASFVMLDPAHPMNRIRLTCAKVDARVAIVSSRFSQRLMNVVDNLVVLDHSLAEELSVERASRIVTSPRDAAYVIFTSGSTGEPKGAIVEHRSFASAARGMATRVLIDGETRSLQFASYSFGAALMEIMVTLIAGGCVCVLSDEERMNAVPQAMNARGVNWAFFTPSFSSLLSPELVPSLKTLTLGGEAVNTEQLRVWADHVNLFTLYGSAEQSVISLGSKRLSLQSNSNEIGTPFPGNRAWIVDAKDGNRLVPVGAVGELVTEGPVVAREYMQDPDKTRAAFPTNFVWRSLYPGAPERFYKTGDLVKYTPEGAILYVGRRDGQIKLRGQRIELGEIEYHLKRAVASSVSSLSVEIVVPQGEKPDKAALAAFIALGDEYEGEEDVAVPSMSNRKTLIAKIGEDVEKRLAEVLPSHMVPHIFFPLRQLPLTVSGKVNRRVLREIGSRVPAAQFAEFSLRASAKRPPATPLEKTLQSLWSQVLSITPSEISADDAFFDVGGDSLSAMRLSAAAREAGLSLRVADIFAEPILSEMAEKCCQTEETRNTYRSFSNLQDVGDLDSFLRGNVVPQVKVRLPEIEDAAWATHLQTQMVAASQLQQRYTVYYVTLDFDDDINTEMLKDACRKVVAHHAILRTVFVYIKQRLLQVVIRSPTIEIEEKEVDTSIEEACTAYVEEDKQRALHISEQGVRFAVLKSSATKTRLVIRLPHAQYDAVSIPIILESLSTAYTGHTLAPSPSFAAFLHATQPLQPAATHFWRTQLSSAPVTEIVSHRTPIRANPLTSTLTTHIPRPAHPTPHAFTTVLKAAWSAVLAGLSNTPTVVFGETLANRAAPLAAADRVAGPCLTVAPVVVHHDAATTTRSALLARVAAAARAAAPHRHVPFAALGLAAPRFGSTVAHMQLDAVALFADGGATLPGFGPASARVGWLGGPWDSADVAVETTPIGDEGGVRVDLHFCEGVVGRGLAGEMAEELGRWIGELWDGEGGDRAVELRRGEARLPVRAPGDVEEEEEAFAVVSADGVGEAKEEVLVLCQEAQRRVLGLGVVEDGG
ncbi:similar to nonribosomal peptide synthetase [Neofusicoccum parvum]|uniref:Similar to nonribosomal peptide synthetase n=1 Tax=Neofusicoccum parvum TaxID=310453 RepID=A0ACB5RU62_9PEZI|nr:similar to nonribosomal peptide synthetase [Neofusicoccum parvum]